MRPSEGFGFLAASLSLLGALEAIPAPSSALALSTGLALRIPSPAIQPDGYGTAVLGLSTHLRPSATAATYLRA